ncbi:sulfurtransferase [Tahibacter soli]|uniref:Rhodanese-like domain-containing protein n=1 Tax=Tahibacter soli TaxID=2983605 RepID=A0A9X4BHF0_9GAMM|nr:rhodanese-like domain-containing protein [Tahibacter soli]MDC8012761.1 rhodanese-like domain-containing protein [Tahibacter soli]
MTPSNRFKIALFVLLQSLAAAAQAGDARGDLVVDAAWLAAHVDDPDLVLLHVGDRGEYAKGHIRGARLVSLDDVSVSEHTRDGLMLEMPDADALRARLEKLGISDASRIVVYYGNDWVSPATRVVFTLQYAGLGDRTTLLDGGMPAWVKQGGALSKDVPEARPGKLAALAIEPLIVDADYVREHRATPGIAIVDGRAAAYYDGVETGGAHGQTDRTGHVAGARSIPFTELTDDTLRLRPTAELKARFDAAGIAPGDTIVGYCHIGQQATAMLFAARLLGHPVRLYDGSFQDWSRGKDNPVETVARGRP